MKISIITAVYNDSNSLDSYFRALKNLNYPKKDFEIVIANDGSTDDTKDKLCKIKKHLDLNVRIVNLQNNTGVANATHQAVLRSRHKYVLLLGCKNTLDKNALINAKKINYPVIMGRAKQHDGHIFDRFLFLVRSKIFKNRTDGDFFIDKFNFETVLKGTTVFLCDKKLFLTSQVSNKDSRHCSDDTKLLWNIVQKKKIFSTDRVKCNYHTRKTFKANLKHIYARGPKFVDYHYRPFTIYFWLINLTIGFIILLLYQGIKYQFLTEVIWILLVANVILSFFISRKLKDLLIVFMLFPLFSITFFLGIIKGLTLKLIRYY